MKTEKIKKIPVLKPIEFDNFLFKKEWKPWYRDSHEEFHISRIESYKAHLNIPLEPHRRLVNFFVFITKGKIIRSKGLTNYELGPNHFFFLPADQITSIEYYSPDVEGYYCHFIPDIFNDRSIKNVPKIDFHFFQIVNDPIVHVKNKGKFIQLLEILINEYESNIIERYSLIPIYLLAILTEVSLQTDAVPIQNNTSATLLTQRYKNALLGFIYEKKTVLEFADYLKVTANHLNKSIKITTGKSAHQLLDEMRLLEAKVLLKQTTLSIGDIAYKIGRFDPSDFARFFKSKTGISPLEYRQS
jgi:AraC family transcriptional regulator, transcriptional activator of pobA